MLLETFKNGKLNGDWTMFYENGKLLGTAYFEDGEIKKVAFKATFFIR